MIIRSVNYVGVDFMFFDKVKVFCVGDGISCCWIGSMEFY